MPKLPKEFYLRENVLQITTELLGKFLVTKINGAITGGMITEAEAYAGEIDSASHAFKGRRTRRNEIMFAHGGTAYVYICYGIHHLFNVVTNQKDIPHAILIRGIEPTEGIEVMLKRRKMKAPNFSLTAGPGALSQAMGIHVRHTGLDLLGDIIWIEDRGVKIPPRKILRTIRVGVESSGKDARLPYRYIIKDNPWVTRTPR
ncbi:MAG TPA: DNA-3-methyladenine glycosylase [Chitinophagales bacterium]|nr:DNA-3-methyladenine glycosylase [Chitinophagales bacterium]